MAESSSGTLTTHVLDTATGKPAAKLSLALYKLDEAGKRQKILETLTNDDGRCDGPLLSGTAFETGVYELVFEAGAYFETLGLQLPEPKFLDEVVLRFGMAEPIHYHVPLLISPFGYSTYRGS
ncbi:5-hydroxyisourate hydrolase [Fulvimarina manganoxydans]|uniref:5-hydroxyisourate hydrolase n=1 Tax=Fulvimarina manganoxydans TaxID=937218 RepID=A0A1W1YAK4_9HYPH|nr:hydroxyisourate hydrolase [Fulvimarina manganoxydans]SMC32778.1 5-hydroxyisourate hydrolase [Fulvimarina manganoxydans]